MKRLKKQSSSEERPHFAYSRFDADDDHNDEFQLNSRVASGRITHQENTLEGEVQDGDTLQAIAIRYRCSVADIKRLNKIERDLHIHAFKTIRVPQTVENLLVNHLPTVHKSGQSSPKNGRAAKPLDNNNHIFDAIQQLAPIAIDQQKAGGSKEPSINEIILNTTIVPNPDVYHDDIDIDKGSTSDLTTTPNDEEIIRQRRINAQQRHSDDYSFSGSDCDLSWICLFICILALCFAIPLIYVVYIAEHHVDPEHVHARHT